MRRSSQWLLLLAGLVAAGGALHTAGRLRAEACGRERVASARLVRDLGLTDLCLFPEARYTRHPALADRHAAFQDHPGALDHFPAGSLVRPPRFPSLHERPLPAAPQHP